MLIEAAKAAAFDRPTVLHDNADGNALIEAAALRLPSIDREIATRRTAPAFDGDTTYLCVVDDQRMGVSLIQSNASNFGSWLVEPSTGINLHNRGLGFSLEQGHPAELAPGKRPPHTLSPAMATNPDGSLAGVFGTMGGDGQPQILLQLAARIFHHAQSPAAAVHAARWVLNGPTTGFDTWSAPQGPHVLVEGHAPADWRAGLEARGHTVRIAAPYDSAFGHAHAILVEPDGMLCGAADPRCRIGSVAGASQSKHHRVRYIDFGAANYAGEMRVDTNFFCTVPMPDAGDPAIAATARRYGNDAVIECYKNLVDWSRTADSLGFDTMWLTEHHFQHEGYEVLPNLILFGMHLAQLTKDLRLGQMFNVVPQWNPLRLAEDFALADIITGGRMEFGVGRGTVPREAWALGTVVASGDNAMSGEHDRINREVFEE